MTPKTSYGILLVQLSLLALVQIHITASSGTGTSTSEFSILSDLNTPCPMRTPCYTLSQVMDNPSNYFTSNTTVVFPPGHHEVSTEGQLVIQNVNNIFLVGDNNDSTVINCVGEFGLAFINITNLTVSKLHFSECGASMSSALQLATNLFNGTYDPFTFLNDFFTQVPSIFTIYLLHVTNLNATNLSISHSNGMGVLGANIFGVSYIQQAVFFKNMPNCAIIFLDSYSPAGTSILYITDTLFELGRMDPFTVADTAAGLNIIAIQTMYHVKSYIENVTAYRNIGSIYGNMFFKINCRVALQATHVTCTGGNGYGFVLKHEGDSINCKSQVVSILHSYFGRSIIGVSISFDSITYSVSM